jgi:hypothetical protein
VRCERKGASHASSVAVKRRRFWLIATSALAPLSLGVSEPALAQCTPLDASGNATCAAGNYTTPPLPPGTFPAPITYDTNNGLGGTPINLTLQSGVNVLIPAGAPGINAVNAANTTGTNASSAPISITANGTAADPIIINNTANPGTSNNTALRIQSSGAAIINATNTTIGVAGTASDWAILAFAMPNLTGLPHDVSVNWSGPSLTSAATSIEGGGIQADNRAIGNAIVVASGNINVTGPGNLPTQYGLACSCR